MKREVSFRLFLGLFIFTLFCVASSSRCLFAEDKVVAIVNNDIITQKDLSDFSSFIRVQFARQLQGKELEEKVGAMKQDLLQRLIEDRLMLQQAKNDKVTIETARIQARINDIKKRYATEAEFEDDLAKQGLVQADLENKIREQMLMYAVVEQKVRAKIIIRPDEITSFYNANKRQFLKPEERQFMVIIFQDESVASAVSYNLRRGEKMEALAEKYPFTVDKLSAWQGENLRKEIEQTVFKLGLEEISNPVKIGEQYYVFKLENILGSQQLNLVQSQEKIQAYLFENKLQEALAKYLDELKNNHTLKLPLIRVGLTIGDPAGIGPAIVLKAVKQLKKKVNFTVIGDSFVLAKAAKLLKIKPGNFPFGEISRNGFLSKGIKSIALGRVKLVDLNNLKPKNFAFGKLSATTGRASLDYLDAALRLLNEKRIDCLVTGPISKEAINLAGAKFSGHTEYLANRAGCNDLVMMLINDHFKFSLVTRHIPLKDVCRKLTQNNLKSNILNTIKGLKYLFLIKKPKLVVCAVNPHASDNGVIGLEEKKLIIPAIRSLRSKIHGAVIDGPFSADLAITQAAKGKFDCIIALYHDQALIPLKLTGFDHGVNLTLGLPFVRTSPLHGTAFDIAGNPRLANANSLIAAIKLAVKCAQNQRKA